MAGTEIVYLTASELVERYESRELSPVEAAQAALDRIEKHNDKVNAFCWLDAEWTLREARRSEERYRRGTPMGPLDGVPVPIKDILLTRGQPNRKGSTLIPEDQLGEEDAPCIAAMKRSGFVPLGRVTTPEFGWKGVTDNPLTGVTRNPWDPQTTPGGSSGGTAAAIALGMGPLGPGTDAGGSVRIPAGFTGIVGLKPTHGRIPMWPVSAFGTLAHVGPMAWTVKDAALLMNVMCEPDGRDATLPEDPTDFVASLEGGVKGMRIAFSPNLGYVKVDPEVAAKVDAAAKMLEELGAHVERVDPGFEDPIEPFNRLFYGGAANALRSISAEKRQQMDAGLVQVAEWAEGLSALDHWDAVNKRGALTERMGRFHETYDLMLTPSLPIPAFEAGREVPEGWPHDRWPTWTPFSYPFNLTGQPAASVPCGFTESGLPVGLQIVGPRHGDATVLRVAHAYQCARPLTHKRPEV